VSHRADPSEPGDGDVSPRAGPVARRRNPQFTYVELVLRRDRIERWVRFGMVAEEHVVGLGHRFVGFAPGAVFGFVRWAGDGRGAGVSRLDILQAVRRAAPCSTVSGVTPGAEILLRLSGWPRVKKALAAIDAVEALGVDPADAAPDYWRHLGHRLGVGEAARSYTLERHAAWLARRELAP
jgi:hypothetical protein